MPTTNVLVTRTGTGFTVDVTACNLDTSLVLKDFTIRHAGVQVPNTDYTKTTATTLTYTGASLPSNTQVEVRRNTPRSPVFQPRLGLRVRSQDWLAEFDRITRRAEEYDLNGVGTTGTGAGQVLNDAYGPVWTGDVVYAPTRGSLWTKLEAMASLVSPAFTGTPTVPTAAPGTNTTQVASTAYVVAGLGTKANIASPAFTGNPTAPTQVANNNSTRLANTAYVDAADALKANIASPALTGTPTAPTAAGGTNTTQIATTAFVVSGLNAKADIASPTFTGTPAAPSPALGTNSTRLATANTVQIQYRPAFAVWRNGNQLNLNGNQKILFNAEEFDTDNAFDAVTNNRFTVPTGLGGVYHFDAGATVTSTVATSVPMALLLVVNGVVAKRLAQVQVAVNTDWVISGSCDIQLAQGDTVEVFVTDFGVGGVDINITGAQAFTWFNGHRLGV